MSARGFTLIELLVVVVIIVIISSIGLAFYYQALNDTRDKQRKSDLRSISQALEIYFQRNGRYPCTTSWALSSGINPWISDNCAASSYLDSNYIEKIPKDPKGDLGNPVTSGTNITGYGYWTPPAGGSCPALGQTYILAAGLEDNNDRESDRVKNYQYCGGDLVTRTDSNAYVVIPQ